MTRTLISNLARPILALSLAASLVLTPVSATPARADSQDTAALIAALIALGVFGAAVNNNNNKNTHVAPVDRDRPSVTRPNRNKALPKSCMRTFKTRYGKESFFGATCLQTKYRRWKRLPKHCELRIRTRNQYGERVRRNVYQPRCLREAGYTIARRR